MKQKQKKYSKLIDNLGSKTSKWEISYEKESDSFYWTKTPFPSKSRLVKVAKEIFFFLNKKGDVEGLMIQPFNNNFVSHNEEVSNIMRILSKKEGLNEFTVSKKTKELDSVLSTLTATIKKDIYRDAVESNCSLDDIEELLTTSVK
ncbi:MAG: hypothetical protein WD471_00880 [Candidatus Paceibacterota bacterium]